MTRQYPQHQSITTPLSSREKGDWGYKRPFPLKSTMTTSTPLIRVKNIDSVENVTDFASAADHSLSLEKFQELHVAMSVPRVKGAAGETRAASMWPKSVFEEDHDSTDPQGRQSDEQRWKFKGPWLARMGEGDFSRYLSKTVHPKRAQFRALLKRKLAEDITTSQKKAAMEKGTPAPPKVEPRDITEAHFSEYLRTLRHDRATLYSLVSKFLDLAPLAAPIGVTGIFAPPTKSESPYGKSGPPPSHPSAGISYLRTNSYMENHPVYGPQARRSPALARVVYPRAGYKPAKLGVGGFVADVPIGDNEFNIRFGRGRTQANKMLNGIAHLDTTTYGGAKAYIEPQTATVDPSGKVHLQLRETHPEAQVIAKESKGLSRIYDDSETKAKQATPSRGKKGQARRMERIADEMLSESPQTQS
ncbi:mitochondrial ribosomal protein subunit domain-containing protein [Pochonia chlamydosporia 170]|uniref:Mitochondrial ribosomal protein subunit domain-containing protein n=1 Tax=Pochonia chlamydosporia 170 TaxID=1380566 RepID=A0A179FL30_METCM|nr:mitochondrial ribosomal protein subunit domain-containing protein [Pochonia chlamydosporia 170]OAQ66048.1 mitochondrial ribosomal protein subunit domain-containing protein [Pochonia chlamydosporia 170]